MRWLRSQFVEHRDAAVVHILTNEDKLAQVEEALAPLRKKDLNLEGVLGCFTLDILF